MKPECKYSLDSFKTCLYIISALLVNLLGKTKNEKNTFSDK